MNAALKKSSTKEAVDLRLEVGLYSALAAYSGLTALVDKRIYPAILPQDCKLPAVCYFRVSTDRPHAMGADTGDAVARIQLTAFAETYAGADAIAAQLKGCLQDAMTTWGGAGGVTIQRSFFENEAQFYDSESDCHNFILDFLIWYKE